MPTDRSSAFTTPELHSAETLERRRLTRLALEHLEAGEFRDALEVIDTARELAPDNVTLRLYKDSALRHLSNDVEPRLELMEEAFALRPDSAAVNFQLARALLDTGEPGARQRARHCVEAAIAARPDMSRAHLLYSSLLDPENPKLSRKHYEIAAALGNRTVIALEARDDAAVERRPRRIAMVLGSSAAAALTLWWLYSTSVPPAEPPAEARASANRPIAASGSQATRTARSVMPSLPGTPTDAAAEQAPAPNASEPVGAELNAPADVTPAVRITAAADNQQPFDTESSPALPLASRTQDTTASLETSDASTTAAAQTAPAPVQTAPPRQAQHETAAEVEETIARWRTDWSTGDIDSYARHYAVSFRQGARNRDEWIAYKRRLFSEHGSISVEIEGLAIEKAADAWRASFIQLYTAGAVRDRGRKTLVLVREDGALRIRSERWEALD